LAGLSSTLIKGIGVKIEIDLSSQDITPQPTPPPAENSNIMTSQLQCQVNMAQMNKYKALGINSHSLFFVKYNLERA